MNERIFKLALKAMDFQGAVDTDTELKLTNSELEKFAELIVWECVGILMKPEYPMNHPEELADYNRGWVNGRLLGIDHIREHFEVEQ